MAPLRNSAYGRGYTITMPPKNSSFRSRVKDYCLCNRNKMNSMAWIDRQSKIITAAYGGPWQPKLPARSVLSRNYYCSGRGSEVEIEGQVIHEHTIEDGVRFLACTTSLDVGSEERGPASRQLHQTGLWSREALISLCNDILERIDEPVEGDSSTTPFDQTPIDLLPGVPKLSPVEHPSGEQRSEEQPHKQTWQIDSESHLIVSDNLSTQLSGLKLASPDLDNMKDLPLHLQCTLIAKLASENRQLDALQEALQFALNDAFKHTNGVMFTARVRLYDYAVGVSYPVIDICMDQWTEGTELQCYLAYYLLRGMLKRYGDLPFPDRVDFWEVGPKSTMLLVPYGAGWEEVDSEEERVRRRIVGEMGLM